MVWESETESTALASGAFVTEASEAVMEFGGGGGWVFFLVGNPPNGSEE